MCIPDNVKQYEVFQCEMAWEEIVAECFTVVLFFFFISEGEVFPKGMMYNWQESGETPGSVQDE